jgi:hypothetical protein
MKHKLLTKAVRPDRSSPQGQPVARKRLLPKWYPLWAVFIVVLSYLLSAVVGELLLVLYGLSRGWGLGEIESWLTTSTTAQFVNAIIVYTVMAAIIYYAIRRTKVSLREFGLVRPRLRDLGVAFLGVPAYLVGYIVLLTAMTALFPAIDVEQEQQLGFEPSQSILALTLTFVCLVVLPPIVEELVMRGYLFTSLRNGGKFWVPAIVTSVIFGVAHLQLGIGAPPLWVAAIDTFVLSMIACYMRFKTGSLWPAILLHGAKNGLAFTVLFLFPLWGITYFN